MDLETVKDHYCSEKFTWLSVDLEKRQNFSCCAVPPQKIDIDWIKNNPGQIFNSPHFQEERSMMLANKPVASCESVCWQPERSGLVSRRMLWPTQQRFTKPTVDSLQELHIILGSTCNMTCSYCCKQYSSSWLRDVAENGPYLDHDRFIINPLDRLLLQIKHPQHQKSDGFHILLEEIEQLQVEGKIYLTGGETFLYNNLVDMVNRLTKKNHVMIYSGLGVDPHRFASQLEKIENPALTTLIISAEGLGKFYEFNRYGNSWKDFTTNLDEIQRRGFDWYFRSTLSNLTVFGFREFIEHYPGQQIKYEFCVDPECLGVNVIDEASKQDLIDQFSSSHIVFRDDIVKTLATPTTENLRQQCANYVLEFARRRQLDLEIYPDSFVSWLQDAR